MIKQKINIGLGAIARDKSHKSTFSLIDRKQEGVANMHVNIHTCKPLPINNPRENLLERKSFDIERHRTLS